ncbi:MAG: hypothetical protein ACYC6L_08970 [Anaerolineae bacterium]
MSDLGIVNIINFIRACEPRDPQLDLLEPVIRQIELVRAHRLPATWLLQYDALIDARFVSLLKNQLDERQEIGIWFEVMQPLVEKAGLVWRGRFPWDWHAHVGFSIGYTPAERERLADVFMAEFKRVWGYYPASVGSWLLDAHLLAYLADRYQVNGACLCKEQWGTDGYTLWGGYYNQAYYPSRMNALMPAQDAAQQIPIPVFRMLGSDPIYQYDVAATANGQKVITLEPVYVGGEGGGGVPAWVRWFMRTAFETPALSFGYTQMGQENSFGWPAMRAGLTDQVALADEWQAQGKLRVEILRDSAAWYRDKYPLTPASTITALEDWRGQEHASVWYCSRYYRVNWFWEAGRCWIRDIHKFDERYPERYLQEVCPVKDCTYDTLPVVDGLLWGARLELVSLDGAQAIPLRGAKPRVREQDADTLVIEWPLEDGSLLTCTCLPDRIRLHSATANWGLYLSWQAGQAQEIRRVDAHRIEYEHEGYRYQVACPLGSLAQPSPDTIVLCPQDGAVELHLA